MAVPFTEFIGGMQNDRAMPTDENFKPIFVAFIWQAVAHSFFNPEDAKTRAVLLGEEEKKQAGGETDISRAAEAAAAAMDEENPDKEELINEFKNLAANSHLDDDDDDDEDDDAKVERVRAEGRVQREEEDDLGDKLLDIGLSIVNPLQNLVFGRLMGRGQKTGKVMGRVLAKLMEANEGVQTKVCLMANSLGAHVLSGILKDADYLPHKIHSVFYVQGAISDNMFTPGAKFEKIKDNVAGPVVCTYSDKDNILRNFFGLFHGKAIGLVGVPVGERIEMKGLDEYEADPYVLSCGQWNSVDGSRYIDEGNALAGGHGDFKEDETTSLYWSAIKTEVDPEAYKR